MIGRRYQGRHRGTGRSNHHHYHSTRTGLFYDVWTILRDTTIGIRGIGRAVVGYSTNTYDQWVADGVAASGGTRTNTRVMFLPRFAGNTVTPAVH